VVATILHRHHFNSNLKRMSVLVSAGHLLRGLGSWLPGGCSAVYKWALVLLPRLSVLLAVLQLLWVASTATPLHLMTPQVKVEDAQGNASYELAVKGAPEVIKQLLGEPVLPRVTPCRPCPCSSCHPAYCKLPSGTQLCTCCACS
jgi:magnesium-transporting ATPase (P-type)